MLEGIIFGLTYTLKGTNKTQQKLQNMWNNPSFLKHGERIFLPLVKLFSIGLLSSFVACSSATKVQDARDAAAAAYMEEHKPPGLAVCVFKNGALDWSYAYGYADIEKKIPFASDIVMNVGSISKTITTTAVLQLWEKGKLDLDADVNEYLDFSVRNPRYPDTIISVRHLLTHTSSIKDGMAYQESYQCGEAAISLSEWISNYLSPDGRFYDEHDNFYDWSAGTDYSYSNVAYGLLGLIVEELSGQSFEAYCQENIFSPLGMDNSSWFISGIDASKRAKQYALTTEDNENIDFMAKLIKKKVDGFSELCDYSFYNYPDGLFKSSVQQLSYFMLAMMNDGNHQGKQILKASTVAEMFNLQVEGNDVQGLGWKRLDYGDFAFWGHSGRDPGVRTHMYFNAENELGIILFQNNDEGSTIELLEKIYTLATANEN